MSLPVRHRRLPFGDVQFRGRGPDGPIRVGIEYKTLSDYLSCIVTKRLVSHQIPGMVRRYHHLGRWLIVEGIIRPHRDSTLEAFRLFPTRRGTELGTFDSVRTAITYSQMRRFEITLRKRAQIEIIFTSCRADTLGTISALYHWYQKPWESHHAHLALPALQDDHPRRIEILFRRPSVLRRVASCLPGIGWTRSELVARRFRSVRKLLAAPKSSWLDIPGIGPKTAEAVFQALRTEEDK